MKRIPGWLAVAEILITVWVALAMASVLVYAPFWLLGGLSRKRRRPAERAMRSWPSVAILSLVVMVVVVMISNDDIILRMGRLTVWSASVFLASVLFAVAAFTSAVAVWRAPRQEARAGVRRYSMVVTAALLVAAAYLAYWGVIGLRTWA